MRKTQARLDDFQAEALRMLALIEEIRRSAHAPALETQLETLADKAEAFADAATDLEAAYFGRRHELALARAAKEAA
jgi:hypothetical protein